MAHIDEYCLNIFGLKFTRHVQYNATRASELLYYF
jgi:hypothetical protein